MLDIDMEFRKGILFVRLKGSLSPPNYDNLDKTLGMLIEGNNIRFITFNLSQLEYIDWGGIRLLVKYTTALGKVKGQILICGVVNELVKLRLHNSDASYYMNEVNDELGAIKYINLGGYL